MSDMILRDEKGVMRLKIPAKQMMAILDQFEGKWRPRTTKDGVTSHCFELTKDYVWSHYGMEVYFWTGEVFCTS